MRTFETKLGQVKVERATGTDPQGQPMDGIAITYPGGSWTVQPYITYEDVESMPEDEVVVQLESIYENL